MLESFSKILYFASKCCARNRLIDVIVKCNNVIHVRCLRKNQRKESKNNEKIRFNSVPSSSLNYRFNALVF